MTPSLSLSSRIAHPGAGKAPTGAAEAPSSAPIRWKMGYDALLRPAWMLNGAGDRHSWRYDSRGHLLSEGTFAGQRRVFCYDAGYRVVRTVRPDGSAVAFRYDDADRLVAREGPSDEETRYQYDFAGRLAATTTIEGDGRWCSIEVARDAVGRVVREVQQTESWRFSVDRTFDKGGRVVAKRYGSGWSVAIERTAAGAPASVKTGSEALRFSYDACGREVGRQRVDAPQSILTERTADGLVARVAITQGRTTLRERSYDWSAQGPVATVSDPRRGVRSYELDWMGRPLAASGLGTSEKISYSKEGMPLADGQGQGALGPGGRPREARGVELLWDELGRLAARRANSPGASWTYAYDGNDRLATATRGDGLRIDYRYDPAGRRIAETSGGVTRWFGWDSEAAVEEQTADHARVRRIFGDDDYTPLLESSRGRPFRTVATDAASTPWAYVDEAGGVSEIDLTTRGEVAFQSGDVGPLRFAGQRADEASGLSYQRFRFYAPDLGLFMTPDPLGLVGSAYDIGFVPNATFCVDPLGLKTVIIQGPEAPGGGAVMGPAASYDKSQIPGSTVVKYSDLQPDSLSEADQVIIDAHGTPGGLLLGSTAGDPPLVLPGDARVLSSSDVAKALQNAGFKGGPNRSVVVGACNGATEPKLGSWGGGVAQAIAQATGSNTWGARPYPGFVKSAIAGGGAGDVEQNTAGAPTRIIAGAWYLYTPDGKGQAVDKTPDYKRVEERASVPCLTCSKKGNAKGKAAGDGQARQGDPVDVMTGAMFTEPSVDFTLLGFFPLSWTRSYSTANASATRGLGYGWTQEHEWTAERMDDGQFAVTTPDGQIVTASVSPDGTPTPLLYGRTVSLHDGHLVLLLGDGLWRILRRGPEGFWRLTDLVDASSNVARLLWRGAEIIGMIDTTGRRVERLQEGNKVVFRMTLSDGGDRAAGADGARSHTLATYEIDARGDLVAATDANGRTTRYTYDRHHYLVACARADGLVFRYRYAESEGGLRCAETWGELQGHDILRELGCEGSSQAARGIFHVHLSYGPAPHTTTAVDALGGVHRYEGNELGLVTRYVDPRGIVQTYQYDADGVMTSWTDGLNRSFAREIDRGARKLTQTGPQGLVRELRYDEAGQLEAVAAPGGAVWKRGLDERGRLVELTDPAGAAVRFVLDGHGQIVELVWPDGGADAMAYDTRGNLVRYKPAGGGTWAYEYDGLGRRLSVTDPHGAKSTHAYDDHGNLVATQTPRGARTEYELDALKRPVVTRYPGGAQARRRYVGDALVEVVFAGPA